MIICTSLSFLYKPFIQYIIQVMKNKNRSALNILVFILFFSTCSNNDSSELSSADVSSNDEIILQDTTTTTLQEIGRAHV